MRIRIENGRLYKSADRTFTDGYLLLDDAEGKILYVGSERPDADAVFDARGAMVVPGLVDVHTHGRAGADFGAADTETVLRIANAYLAAGVTTVMPTLASDTPEGLAKAADRLKAAEARQTSGQGPMGARLTGIHLEGRYLNPAKRGAHAECLLHTPDAEELRTLLPHLGLPCHITAALELDADGSFTKTALDAGATLAIGHTCATCEQAKTALENGVTAFTHLFNAMPPLHHRDGGAVCAGLNAEAFVELICDGMHVSPDMIRLAYRAHNPDFFVLVTDSMEATGMPDGEYAIAGLPVTVKNGRAVTHEGALAGSTLSLFDAVLNLSDFAGIPFEKALYHATLAPAKEAKIDDRVGSLEAGKTADLLIVREGAGKEGGSAKGRPGIEKIMIGGHWYDE